MSTIQILKTGITELDVDVMVNAANSDLYAGGGVCGAIFRAAGYEELQEACDRIGHCDTGKAVLTPGFRTGAKYIAHAVGPVWNGGDSGEPQLLYSCYGEALRLAAEQGCHSIAFPLISSGIYGYPMAGAWNEAIRACRDFIRRNPDAEMEILFAVLDDNTLRMGRETLRRLAPEAGA